MFPAMSLHFFMPRFMPGVFCVCVCWVFAAVHRLSLVVASRGYSLVAVLGFLIAVASLVVEHRL